MKRSCDVLVVGGGVAGVSAAVAAARHHVRTLLVEQEKYLGGTGYAGLFQHICGLYVNGPELAVDTLNPGLAREISASLIKKSGKGPKKIGRVYVLPYRPDDLQQLFLSLTAAEPDLTVLCGASARNIRRTEGTIASVDLEQGGELTTITPSMVIDCTGNGNVAAAAGAPFELSSPRQRQFAGFTIRIKGLRDPDEWLGVKVPYHLTRAVQEGLFPTWARFTSFCLGDSEDEGYCKFSIDSDDAGGRDEQARKDADAIHRYLASVVPAFKTSFIAGVSLKVLDREGRRISGEYTLTADDVLTARKFPDGVVKNAWPIELWDRERGTIYRYVPAGAYYEIPFRSQKVAGLANLLTAGRCISVTREALGSSRVMGTCISLGEHAGRAAAFHVKNGKYPEDVKDLVSI